MESVSLNISCLALENLIQFNRYFRYKERFWAESTHYSAASAFDHISPPISPVIQG